jgi:formimidoylglutamate deiminase
MWRAAVAGGARASARPVAGLRAGERADFVVLSSDALDHGLSADQALAGHLFARPAESTIAEVWVGGQRRIAQARHALDDTARRRFIAARAKLMREA